MNYQGYQRDVLANIHNIWLNLGALKLRPHRTCPWKQSSWQCLAQARQIKRNIGLHTCWKEAETNRLKHIVQYPGKFKCMSKINK